MDVVVTDTGGLVEASAWAVCVVEVAFRDVAVTGGTVPLAGGTTLGGPSVVDGKLPLVCGCAYREGVPDGTPLLTGGAAVGCKAYNMVADTAP